MNKTEVKNINEAVEKKFSSYYKDLKFQAKNTKDGANGVHYTFTDGDELRHLKIVDKSKCELNGHTEIEILKNVDSSHIIKLIDHGDLDSDNYYLVFEHIDGTTVNEIHNSEWGNDCARKFLNDLTKALESLKKSKVVHRDIKPKNIIKNTNNDFILLDLGIGYFLDRPQKSNTPISKTSGAKYYSSPEQMWIASGDSNYDITWISDQFSLGVVAYFAFSGVHPFSGDSKPEINNYTELITGKRDFLKHLSELRPDLDKSLCDTVMKMLELNPSKRFTGISQLKDSVSGTTTNSTNKHSHFYIKTPDQAKPGFVKYLVDSRSKYQFGAVVTTSDKNAVAESLISGSVEVIFDPQTYKLQTNKSPTNLEEKFNLPKSKENKFEWDISKLTDWNDTITRSIARVSNRSGSKKLILPYYIVDNPDNSYLKLSKDIWKNSKKLISDLIDKDVKVYAGIIIPKSMVMGTERVKLMDKLIADYDLEGIYVVFENTDNKVRTTSDKNYLQGVNDYIKLLNDVFEDVIVSMSDISSIPLLDGSDYVVCWAKSSRHFNLNPPIRQTKKGEPKPPRKMLYYSTEIFSFVEEKSNINTISTEMGSDFFRCDCKYCVAYKPMEKSYKTKRAAEEFHFYESMGKTKGNFLLEKNREARNKKIIEVLSTCQINCIKVKEDTILTAEVIPDLKTLIAIVEDRQKAF